MSKCAVKRVIRTRNWSESRVLRYLYCPEGPYSRGPRLSGLVGEYSFQDELIGNRNVVLGFGSPDRLDRISADDCADWLGRHRVCSRGRSVGRSLSADEKNAGNNALR